ncbi:MAG TPA: sulfate ABC transporter substrate-binding protein [Gaiellaceae bacterium]|jgi:sulfate transport system substrate-binding protein|nr:sulfate ABC transporter substrate-binding protein [Gaiellaceae bacterium]
MSMNKPTKQILAGVVLALTLVGGASAASRDTTLALVGYSTPKAVMGKIIQAWQKTPNGNGVSFNQSYGASTDQARAVANGLKADLVFLSTGDDVNLLVDAGLVDSKWNKQGYAGIAADTVVVFAVRNGNPKHIKSWSDLTRPGVQVVTPNPFSSGSAKWNILAAYGAERRLGKTDKQATAYVQKLFGNVVSQDTSGRNATNTFLAGKGDVLLTYESEAINSRLNGQDIQYVIPRQSMLIELPIAVTKSSSNKDKVNQFIQFVKGSTAQDLFAQYGFRPVDKKILAKYASKYPTRPGIFKVDDKIIGGWRNADKVWFDPNKGRMVAIERAIGGPSSG